MNVNYAGKWTRDEVEGAIQRLTAHRQAWRDAEAVHQTDGSELSGNRGWGSPYEDNGDFNHELLWQDEQTAVLAFIDLVPAGIAMAGHLVPLTEWLGLTGCHRQEARDG